MSRHPRRPVNDKKKHIQSILIIGFVIGLIHFELIQNLDTHIIGRVFDDAFEVLWQLEWMPKAIFIEQTNPFFTEKVFFPMGWHLPSAAQPSWYFLLLAPVSNWLGSTLTYNSHVAMAE